RAAFPTGRSETVAARRAGSRSPPPQVASPKACGGFFLPAGTRSRADTPPAHSQGSRNTSIMRGTSALDPNEEPDDTCGPVETPRPAGSFGTWLGEMRAVLRGHRDADVPCDGCVGCC